MYGIIEKRRRINLIKFICNMKTYDFINLNKGKLIYITSDNDLMMDSELKLFISNKLPFKLIKLTKSGLAYLQDLKTNKYYTCPPKNIRLYSELYSIKK